MIQTGRNNAIGWPYFKILLSKLGCANTNAAFNAAKIMLISFSTKKFLSEGRPIVIPPFISTYHRQGCLSGLVDANTFISQLPAL